MALRDILSQGPTIKIKRNGRIETEKILLIWLVMVVKANQLNRAYWVNIEGHSIKTIRWVVGTIEGFHPCEDLIIR